jgi:hypothetical protein
LTVSPLSKLAGLGGAALSGPLAAEGSSTSSPAGQLRALLAIKNGFYAFESALHVFPSSPGDFISIEEWNSASLWRHNFEGLADGLYFFAEDIFGVQFYIQNDEVGVFEPETGDKDILASSVDEWASLILEDYCSLTGYPVAHQWQTANGRLAAGRRLTPRVPFVLGGDVSVSNLVDMAAVDGMLVRANLATQIRNLPEGAKVRYKISGA